MTSAPVDLATLEPPELLLEAAPLELALLEPALLELALLELALLELALLEPALLEHAVSTNTLQRAQANNKQIAFFIDLPFPQVSRIGITSFIIYSHTHILEQL